MSDIRKMADDFRRSLGVIQAAHKSPAKVVTLGCGICGYICPEGHKACGLCGTHLPGKVLDPEDSCHHTPVTTQAPCCTNCGKKL